MLTSWNYWVSVAVSDKMLVSNIRLEPIHKFKLSNSQVEIIWWGKRIYISRTVNLKCFLDK